MSVRNSGGGADDDVLGSASRVSILVLSCPKLAHGQKRDQEPHELHLYSHRSILCCV